MGIVMCMLWLDTSLKAIHNPKSVMSCFVRNVYAMIRYKFESNSQRIAGRIRLQFNVYAMIRYKFESNSQPSRSNPHQFTNVYAMIRYKFESNSQLGEHRYLIGLECVCYD